LNIYQIQKQLRAPSEAMSSEQLEEIEQRATTIKHPITGETFNELAATHLALGVKRNPGDMARVKRITPRFPGLADALLVHFPSDKDFKDIAAGWPSPSEVRDEDEYLRDMHRKRYLPRVDNLLYIAELKAGRLTNWYDPFWLEIGLNLAIVHLHEERVDALASLLALFALPDQYAPNPATTGGEYTASVHRQLGGFLME
jgi:hypothetical protein